MLLELKLEFFINVTKFNLIVDIMYVTGLYGLGEEGVDKAQSVCSL